MSTFERLNTYSEIHKTHRLSLKDNVYNPKINQKVINIHVKLKA